MKHIVIIGKRFSLWLSIFALLICVVHLSGLDDKNIVLFFTSPVLWLFESHTDFLLRYMSESVMFVFYYVWTVYTWSWIGLCIDAWRQRRTNNTIKSFWVGYSVLAVLFVLLAVVFYQVQSSEKAMRQILQEPTKHNAPSIRYAMNQALEQGYSSQVLEDIEHLLQLFPTHEVYTTALYVCGRTATPEAIRLLLTYQRDPQDIVFALQQNVHTIETMLRANQPSEIVIAGIDAAQLLGYTSFLVSLDRIAETHLDSHIQQRATRVMQSINEHPIEQNDKFTKN